MSLYNLLFGMNEQSDLLLAVLGLRKHEVERFRNVYEGEEGGTIEIYTRTGGGNREGYPNEFMRSLPTWVKSIDDEFDSTYCTDVFNVPSEFVQDVKNLNNILGNGLRPEFGQHLLKTLNREPTEGDKENTAYEKERRDLGATAHEMANGHTFVPHNDGAMKVALQFAERNGGKLRSCFGILPLVLEVRTDYYPYPKAHRDTDREYMHRVHIGYDWKIDVAYWDHCKKVFTQEFPLSIAEIDENVIDHLERDNRKVKAQ